MVKKTTVEIAILGAETLTVGGETQKALLIH